MPAINNFKITVPPEKKIYFISDHHFGLPNASKSLEREKLFVQWLQQVKNDAQSIFILGDMFDVWYEYKYAVPKGFVRILGKLAELTDSGVSVYFFTGNHDMWMLDYLEKELNISVFFEPEEFEINRKKFLVGHGDGLGPGDKKYKFLKKIFKNKPAQWLFRWLHPDIGLKLAQYLSGKNKYVSENDDIKFQGKEKERLFLYAKKYLENRLVNYFIFGHRHLPLEIEINENSIYLNTGDWLKHFSYVEFDGKKHRLKYLNKSRPLKESTSEKK